MQTKISKKFVSRLSYFGSGLFVFLGNAGSVLAANTAGWSAIGEPSTPPVDAQMGAINVLKGYMITPLIFIGIAVYLLLLFYKIRKWDPKDLKNLLKIGKISLISAIGVWILLLESDPYTLYAVIIIRLSYIIIPVIYVLTFIFLWEYAWKLILRKKSPSKI